jgi:hypothetical protein
MDEIASDSGQEDRPTFNVGCISCSAVSIRGRGCAARPAVSYRDRDERSRAECETASAPKIEVSKGTSKRESGYSLEAMMSKRSVLSAICQSTFEIGHVHYREWRRSARGQGRRRLYFSSIDVLRHYPISSSSSRSHAYCYSWQREVSSFPPNGGLMGPSVSPGPPWAAVTHGSPPCRKGIRSPPCKGPPCTKGCRGRRGVLSSSTRSQSTLLSL